MSEHRRALDAVTGIPASAGFCEPVEGYADSPMSVVSTVRVMASEFERLNRQLEQAEARAAKLSEALQVAADTPELQGGTWYDMAVAALAEKAGGEK